MFSAIHQQAKSLFQQILLVRRWVAGAGGVYVEIQPGVTPNPFLAQIPGIKTDITDRESGRRFTLRNPCPITSELSRLSKDAKGYSFEVSSLKPINPSDNTPDDFERTSLLAFERGTREVAIIEQHKDGPVYRYMAPLYYEAPCDRCHRNLGYKIGDVRGGISISIPLKTLSAKMWRNRQLTAAFGLMAIILLLGALACVNRRFLKTLGEAQDKLVTSATIDNLTGLLNRRAGLERMEEELSRHQRSGQTLACLLVDLDCFKNINDSFGHQAGDKALAAFGTIVRKHTRKHDIVCRYGGEEFLILLADTTSEAAQKTAEKIRELTAGSPVEFDGSQIAITASIGLYLMQQGDTVDTVIAHTDAALYEAKRTGRNQVIMCEPASGLLYNILQ